MAIFSDGILSLKRTPEGSRGEDGAAPLAVFEAEADMMGETRESSSAGGVTEVALALSVATEGGPAGGARSASTQ
jgi:hypothetical protein